MWPLNHTTPNFLEIGLGPSLAGGLHEQEGRSEAWFHCPLATLPFQQNKYHFMCFYKSYQTSTFLFIIPFHLPIAQSSTEQVLCQGSCKSMGLQVCMASMYITTTQQLLYRSVMATSTWSPHTRASRVRRVSTADRLIGSSSIHRFHLFAAAKNSLLCHRALVHGIPPCWGGVSFQSFHSSFTAGFSTEHKIHKISVPRQWSTPKHIKIFDTFIPHRKL